MDQIAVVGEAVARFQAADDAAFVGCFHEDARVFKEPHLGTDALARGRAELRAWVDRVRRQWGNVSLEVTKAEQRGDGVLADAFVMASHEPDAGAWRVALAIRVRDGLIHEVRPFWQRESALIELGDLQ